uniref:Uncharacterized protein n=1 Tax=Rhizophagus irregularis (strain DAOM 181602 / DAOM 197198 / MUCL 43194) TaxID=747089 RepID=U9U6M0_RHIID
MNIYISLLLDVIKLEKSMELNGIELQMDIRMVNKAIMAKHLKSAMMDVL